MISVSTAKSIFNNFSKIKVLVIGDIMFDHYIWGTVSRKSPEAPVPIVHITRESKMPGGAANVAANLHSLGVNTGILGIVGRDDRGKFLKNYFKQKKIDTRALTTDSRRPTTEKIRIIAHSQQVVRVDREKKLDFSKAEKKALKQKIKRFGPLYDAIILEDYGKGILDQEIIDSVLTLKKKKPSLVISYDPKKGNDLKMHNIDFGTPNLSEALSIVEKRTTLKMGTTPDEIGKALRKRWHARSIFLTLGEKGMIVIEKGKTNFCIPTVAREVYDVSGAGDTVIATATASLAAGATLRQAAILSNYAAGIVVGKIGTQTVKPEEILKKVNSQ